MAEPDPPAEATSDDRFLDGQLSILQPRRGHRSGHDAVLLGAAVPAEARGVIVELGAGVGVAGLTAAHRARDVEAVLIDIDPVLLALAARNAERNGFAGRVRTLAVDVTARVGERAAAGLAAESADFVLLNPPFYRTGRENASPEPGRRRAHHEGPGGLEAWLDTAVTTARQGGRIVVIHRTEALPRLLANFESRVGGVTVLPVQAEAMRPAVRVVVTGVRGSRGPFTLLPALELAGGEAKEILGGRAGLRVA